MGSAFWAAPAKPGSRSMKHTKRAVLETFIQDLRAMMNSMFDQNMSSHLRFETVTHTRFVQRTLGSVEQPHAPGRDFIHRPNQLQAAFGQSRACFWNRKQLLDRPADVGLDRARELLC